LGVSHGEKCLGQASLSNSRSNSPDHWTNRYRYKGRPYRYENPYLLYKHIDVFGEIQTCSPLDENL
jgi:hypothetical protein